MSRRGLAVRCVAAAGILALAGHPAAGWAALSYDLTLGAGVLMNDNLHLDPRSGAPEQRRPVAETIYTVNPALNLGWSGRRDRLSCAYSGEYWVFSGDEELDPVWLHALTAELSWRRWSPFFLEAREERSRVPRSREREGESVLDQIDRNRLALRAGLAGELGPRGAVELAYRGELETFSGIENADQVQRHHGEGLVRYRWSPLWGSELRVSYGEVDRKLTADTDELKILAAVDQRWSERLTLRYSLEWLRNVGSEPARTTAEEPAAPAASGAGVSNRLLKAAEIRGDLSTGGFWTLAYEDTQEERPDGDTLRTGRASAGVSWRAPLGSTLDAGAWYEDRDYRASGREETAWGPTLRARWVIASWAACDLGGSWTSTTINEEGLPEVEDRTTRAAAGIVVLIFKRLLLETGYSYAETASTEALRSFTNNIVYAMATLHFRPVAPGQLPSSGLLRW